MRAVGGEHGHHARHRGTGLVALAAVVGGLLWRATWLASVAAAILSAILNALFLPGMPTGGTGRQGNVAPERREVGLLREGSAALFVVALSFGVVNAFYWSFNADIVSSAGLPLRNVGPILYAVLGAASFAGLLTRDLVDRFDWSAPSASPSSAWAPARCCSGSPPVLWPSRAHRRCSTGRG
jgi:hypothetical protein